MARPSAVSLEEHALNAIPADQFVKFMSEVWRSPLRHQYWDKFKANLSLEDMSRLAKLLPWDDPAARDLDLTVHKRRMHGKLIFLFTFLLPRSRHGPIRFNPFSDIHKQHGRIAILFSLLWDQTWTVQTFFKFEWWTRPWTFFCFISSLVLFVHPGVDVIQVLADN